MSMTDITANGHTDLRRPRRDFPDDLDPEVIRVAEQFQSIKRQRTEAMERVEFLERQMDTDRKAMALQLDNLERTLQERDKEIHSLRSDLTQIRTHLPTAMASLEAANNVANKRQQPKAAVSEFAPQQRAVATR